MLFATAWSAKFGGINSVNYDLATAIAQLEGHKVTCIVANSGATESITDQNVAVVMVEKNYEDAHKWLKDFLQNNIVDIGESVIWIGHDLITGGIAIMAKRLLAGNSVVIHHMDYANYYHLKDKNSREKISSQKHVLKNADVVFAVGPRLLTNAKRLRPNSADTYELEIGRPDASVAKHRPFDFRFAICGRISIAEESVKNIGSAVRAAASILETLESNRGAISLIGSTCTDFKGFLARQPRAVAINEIPYIDNRKEYFEELSDCDILLMPSVKEGFGLAAWEAICMAVPVVITKSSGLYQWLEENKYEKFVSAVTITAIEAIDESTIRTALDNLVSNYSERKRLALVLADKLLTRTWAMSAKKFIALATNSDGPEKRVVEQISPESQIPVQAISSKKNEQPRVNIIDRENSSSGSGFERFEDLLSLSYKKRELVIARSDSTDYAKGQRIKFELWKGQSPNREEFFLYIAPNANIAQSVKRLAQQLEVKKLSPSSICVIRKEKSDIEYLRKIFKSNRINAVLSDYSVKQYVWEFCIDNAFKEGARADSPLNYVDQPLQEASNSAEIVESARSFLIDRLSEQPDYAALLVVATGGMGKTWLCRSLANELPKKMTSDGLVILIQAEGIRAYLAEEGFPDIRIRSLYELYELYGSSISLERSYDRFTFELAVLSGNIVVLIDGLDELATILQERFDLTSFLDSLRELSLGLGSSQVLLTTRDNLLVEEKDISGYAIRKFDLLGFSSRALTRYATKRFHGRHNAIELSGRLSKTVMQAGLGDAENRVIPFLADVVCNILEEEAEEKDDPSFDLVKDYSPYASNNETIDRIIYSVFRREVRRQNIDIDVAELVVSLSELISDHGERVHEVTLREYLNIFYDSRAGDIFKKISLNPLFKLDGNALHLKYDFLQSYFRAIYVIDCLNNNNMSAHSAVNALAKVNAHGCSEFDYVKKYYAQQQDRLKDIVVKLMPSLRHATKRRGDETNGELQRIDASSRAMSALIKIYSGAIGMGSQRLSERLVELFADGSFAGKGIDGLCLFGEFPALDFSGFTVSNSTFSEYKKLAQSKVGGAKFIYCTFDKCYDSGFVDESFGRAEFDQTCVLGDFGKVILTAKSKIDVSLQILEEDVLSFVKSFFKRGYSYDPKKSWISFSTRVDGLKSQNFEKLIPTYVVVKSEKSDETYYTLTSSFIGSVRNFVDNNLRDNKMRTFFKVLGG